MIIELDYPPSTNRLWRVANGRVIPSATAKAFKTHSAWRARQLGVRKRSGPVAVDVTLHPRLTKENHASAIRIDLDNAIKAALDALNGVAWDDDYQVHSITASIGDPLPHGGLSVSVSDAD